MNKIKNIIFDLGGVILTLAPEEAARRFEEIGVKDAAKRLDSYTQMGIFGDLERGQISAEEFRLGISELAGREVSYEECCYAWQGYAKELPERNKALLHRLRREGYRLILLSNTNPYMMAWVDSDAFDGEGHSIRYYMDACYLSFEMKVMKPDMAFFSRVLEAEHINADESLFLDDGQGNVEAAAQLGIHTMQPVNGEDWTGKLLEMLNIDN
jgi:putative hydrolase of the HAD superfamily